MQILCTQVYNFLTKNFQKNINFLLCNCKIEVPKRQKMHLDGQLKTICSKFFEELRKADDEQNQIYYTVLYFIHSAPHLSMLYLSWSSLEAHEKFMLNNQMKPNLPKTGKLIYPPVIRAFEYWDMVQDMYGAPGFNCNPLKTELSENTDRDIVKMMMVMEKIINQVHTKRKVMAELINYKDPRNALYSHKWRIICKTMNKKHRQAVNIKDVFKSTSTREGNMTSDLNGCGDTTWFSDIE